MKHAQWPDECPECGGSLDVYTADGEPHAAVCEECGRTWKPGDGKRPNPGHYEGDGEVSCERALRSMTWLSTLPPMALWWWGCAFKYLWRWPWKNGADDLRKAHDCIGRLLKEVGE